MHIRIIRYIVIFLIINFTALGLGSLATGAAVDGQWYTNINKAPWTPPGWVFGAAWTSIMLLFSGYMAYLATSMVDKTKLTSLFVVQWLLNVSWTPVFFVYEQVVFGLIIISALTVLVGYFVVTYHSVLRVKSLLIAPYFLWLLIATSLNLYILIYN